MLTLTGSRPIPNPRDLLNVEGERKSGILQCQTSIISKYPVSISLPLEVNVNKNDKITTTAEGFAGTYTVDDLALGTHPHHKTRSSRETTLDGCYSSK